MDPPELEDELDEDELLEDEELEEEELLDEEELPSPLLVPPQPISDNIKANNKGEALGQRLRNV